LPLTHHHLHSSFVTGVNQQNNPAATSDFFNRIRLSPDMEPRFRPLQAKGRTCRAQAWIGWPSAASCS